MLGHRLSALLLAWIALGCASIAAAQPCITCRTEKCPTKTGLSDWCGDGKDPLARSTPAGRSDKARKKSAKRFHVNIESVPAGATVTITGDEMTSCLTPCKLELKAGAYHLATQLAGFRTAERALDVNEAQAVTESLEKEAVPATLEVRSPDGSGTGGQLTLDGAPAGALPVTRSLPAGAHNLVVSREGWQDYKETFTLGDGEHRTIEVALRARPRLGALLIAADVDGAEVFVDNRRRDVTPALVENLVEGVHIVEVRRQGFHRWRQEVTVLPGRKIKVAARLVANDGQPEPHVETDAERQAREEADARRAARRAEERRRAYWSQMLLHPFSFTFTPVMFSAYAHNSSTDMTFGGASQLAASAGVRVVWLTADIGASNWTEGASKMFLRYSIGISPITLGTWLGDDHKVGATLFEPFVLYRWYAPPMTVNGGDSFNTIVIGNRFFVELGEVGIGLEISGEVGRGDTTKTVDGAFNIGVCVRVGSR